MCTVWLATLTADPFFLTLGDPIQVKITAYNAYGVSDESEVGGGALIQLVPDAPVNLQNDELETLDDRIGITWDDGPSNGGTPIIDYEVWIDQAADDWIALADSLVEREYIATSLYSGQTYQLKVRARNSVGYGDFSLPISILAAQVPDMPLPPTTSIKDRWEVVIDWTAPYSGGSPITSYVVEIRTSDRSIFAEDLADCDGTDAAIVSSS
jgi:hypothetical protein